MRICSNDSDYNEKGDEQSFGSLLSWWLIKIYQITTCFSKILWSIFSLVDYVAALFLVYSLDNKNQNNDTISNAIYTVSQNDLITIT